MWKPSARSIIFAAASFLIGRWTQLEGAEPDKTALGEQTFSNCAACHGLDGRGGEHAPDIATTARIQQMTDAALLTIIEKGIPAAGMPGFGKLLNDTQLKAVLKYLRVLQRSEGNSQTQGDASQGRTLFFGRGQCAECHMVEGIGGFIAADLSGYGKGHSAAHIREAIVEPNKNLDPRYVVISVKTRSGKQHRGVLRNEDNFSIQMQAMDGSFLMLKKSDLIQIRREAASLMPSDYGSKLTGSELDDLISFLSRTEGAVKREEEE